MKTGTAELVCFRTFRTLILTIINHLTSDHEISYTGSLSNININIDTSELIQDDEDPSRPNGASNIFDNLIQVRKKHPNKFISSYLNINSLRYKFCSIKELLYISEHC
jgi:hypothetical protein